jgi:hypothetical protein
MNTAKDQPVVITIQPELLPLVRAKTTLATTPFPKSTNSAVPKNSAARGLMAASLSTTGNGNN